MANEQPTCATRYVYERFVLGRCAQCRRQDSLTRVRYKALNARICEVCKRALIDRVCPKEPQA